jgi:hypothetical protein
MPKELARKLQAMRDLGRLTRPVDLYPIALTLEQCNSLGLPSTPIKASDKRAAKWRAAMGREQTEIDALATLQPDVLIEIVEDVIEPFFDPTLALRYHEAVARYEAEQTAALRERIGSEQMEEIRRQSVEKLATIEEELEALRAATSIDVDGFEVDPFEPPLPSSPVKPKAVHEPLLSASDDWLTQTEKLVRRKAFDE